MNNTFTLMMTLIISYGNTQTVAMHSIDFETREAAREAAETWVDGIKEMNTYATRYTSYSVVHNPPAEPDVVQPPKPKYTTEKV